MSGIFSGWFGRKKDKQAAEVEAQPADEATPDASTEVAVESDAERIVEAPIEPQELQVESLADLADREPATEPVADTPDAVIAEIEAAATEIATPEPELQAESELEPTTQPAPILDAPVAEAIEVDPIEPADAGAIDEETLRVEPLPRELEPEPNLDPDPEQQARDVLADPAPALVEPDEPQEPKRSWFGRLTSGLSKSSSAIKDRLVGIVTQRKLDDETLEELEDVLISSDLGVETSMAITEALAKDRFNKEISEEEIRTVLAEEVARVLEPVAQPLDIERGHSPHVILVVGVNGTGKTTTIGKLASVFRSRGKSVLLAAGDTFRAAAVEQLKIWGQRVDAPVVARETGADAAGLAFDALDQAIVENRDIVMIDTAGRLQNKADLMAELEKVIRVIQRKLPDAPHDVLLVLDATTGQNALQQVEIFGKVAGVTGLVMTKLDGTARGGILVAISAKYKLPVHAIGVGEGIDDLQPFDAGEFARAIAGTGEIA